MMRLRGKVGKKESTEKKKGIRKERLGLKGSCPWLILGGMVWLTQVHLVMWLA
jgi:hypothetical protein